MIGILPDAQISTATVESEAGDTLLLYTDGLPEARTGQGLYGKTALLEFGRELAPVSATDAVAAVVRLLGTLGAGVTDDTAILALHVP